MNNDSKKVKFSAEAQDEMLSNKFQKQDKIKSLINIPNKDNININNINNINEDNNDEILLNRKRSANAINKRALHNQIHSDNYLNFSDFKNPERIYSYSNNKYSSSSIKKIDDFIIKQTPEKPDNYELDESRYRNSNYKFSSGKKIITTIENPSGVKDFDNSFGVIENYYLEKRCIKDLATRQLESKFYNNFFLN